jgi:hypothetical protein
MVDGLGDISVVGRWTVSVVIGLFIEGEHDTIARCFWIFGAGGRHCFPAIRRVAKPGRSDGMDGKEKI